MTEFMLRENIFYVRKLCEITELFFLKRGGSCNQRLLRCEKTGSTLHYKTKPVSLQKALLWKVILKCIIMDNLLNPNS